MAKRLLDIVFSLALLVAAAPIMGIAALLIKISSKGPVIYRSSRIGKDGTPFVMYKFRTMTVNSQKVGYITTRDDSRVFPVGRVLRKLKIDELPQLVNILQGFMSVVGPRPEDPKVAAGHYVGPFARLLDVRPGLTSPGSLLDYTHGETVEDQEAYLQHFLCRKMEVELYYIDHQTMWYDLRVIFRTAALVLGMLLGKRNWQYPAEYYLADVVAAPTETVVQQDEAIVGGANN